MISVETTSRQRRMSSSTTNSKNNDEWKSDHKRMDPPKRSSSPTVWNPSDLEQHGVTNAAWKAASSDEKKVAKRFQDLSLGLTSSHEARHEPSDESWPYESSPCAMYGGKNTRKGGSAMNEGLFDANFHSRGDAEIEFEEPDGNAYQDRQHSREHVDTGRGMISTDENTSGSSNSSLEKKSSSKDRKLCHGEISRESKRGIRRSKTPIPSASAHFDEEYIQRQHSRSRQPRRSSGVEGRQSNDLNSASHIQQGSVEGGPKLVRSKSTSRKSSYSKVLAWIKPSESEHPAASTTETSKEDTLQGSTTLARQASRRTLERTDSDSKLDRKKSKSMRRNNKDGLSRSSCHASIATRDKRSSRKDRPRGGGDNELNATTYHGGGSADHPPRRVARAVSTDGMDEHGPATVSRRDDLAASSMHGTSTISRIRSSRRLMTASKASRGAADNNNNKDKKNSSLRAMSTHNVRPPEEYGPRNTTVLLANSNHGVGKNAKANGQTRMMNQRSKPSSLLGESTFSGSDDDPDSEDEFACDEADDEEPEPAAPTMAVVSTPPPKTAMVEPHSHNTRVRRNTAEPRRDLIVLMREKKTIELRDMMDKENRRLLHFLTYEHTMGVSLLALSKSVRKEKAAGVVVVAPAPLARGGAQSARL